MFTIPTTVRKNGFIFYRDKRSQKSTKNNLRFSQETLWHSKTRYDLGIISLMKNIFICAVVICTTCIYPIKTLAAEKPSAIFHAFDRQYTDIEKFVCEIGKQGYSHIQISPAQKSNPAPEWWARYQPVDYSIIEGRGSLFNLKNLLVKPTVVR
ncbi:hypothetical protein [Nostoc sp. 'Peltigera malacea cyanobiont' DB3992]|uniref:hypothetical protein n=1 Tax=Nostoc sp. 'Peltigera malacea cyanobiont' DB3992 TaxID=1206980 RepID=UPI00211EC3A8|nr:hypothetical protein [Nostoc sp. 'Peltigera malacea cyanobiont' DB3992]